MRLLPSVVAPSAAAVLAAVLLCSPAASRAATEAANSLPGVTVNAPKQVARPHRPKRAVSTMISHRTSSTAQIPSAAPDSVQGKLAKLERASSGCNGGCETSFKSGKAPWVGCTLSGQEFSSFESTCTDTLTYKHYGDCVDTKVFLGWDRNRAWWHCSSLAAGEKFQVTELKRSRRPR